MKRFIISAITFLSIIGNSYLMYGQQFPKSSANFVYNGDTITINSLSDEKKDTIIIADGVNVHRSGTRYSHSGRTYTEIYEVITDSIVHRFGLEFRSADSSFVRKVPMEGTTRKLYDQMKSDMEFVLRNQERMRKETIEFINRYRTSPEVWLYFKLLGIFGK